MIILFDSIIYQQIFIYLWIDLNFQIFECWLIDMLPLDDNCIVDVFPMHIRTSWVKLILPSRTENADGSGRGFNIQPGRANTQTL